MTPTTHTQAVEARREIGKWLNEGQTKPIDREALAQLCAGFDALTRPQEVAAPVTDAEAEAADVLYATGLYCDTTRRELMRKMLENFVASRAPVAVEPEAQFYCNKCGHTGPTQSHLPCDYLAVPVTPPSGAGGDVGAASFNSEQIAVMHRLAKAHVYSLVKENFGRMPTDTWAHSVLSLRDFLETLIEGATS